MRAPNSRPAKAEEEGFTCGNCRDKRVHKKHKFVRRNAKIRGGGVGFPDSSRLICYYSGQKHGSGWLITPRPLKKVMCK